MNISRRGFLWSAASAIAAGVASSELDPERLLWVPGAKTIFLPSQTIETATTLNEAVERGMIIDWPGGYQHTIFLPSGGPRVYGDLAAFRARVEAQGGSFRRWDPRQV